MPYAQRDYGRALALLTPLAEQGNAVAQLKLGIIFSRGKVGSPDHVAALGWFIKAAEQGQVEAQFELAQDEIEAFKWLELAADTGIGEDRDKALRARSLLAERLTPVEVSWAASRVEDWTRAHLPMSVLASARKP